MTITKLGYPGCENDYITLTASCNRIFCTIEKYPINEEPIIETRVISLNPNYAEYLQLRKNKKISLKHFLKNMRRDYFIDLAYEDTCKYYDELLNIILEVYNSSKFELFKEELRMEELEFQKFHK